MRIRSVPALTVCALAVAVAAGCARPPVSPGTPNASDVATAPAVTTEVTAPAATSAATVTIAATGTVVKPQAPTSENVSAEDGKHFGYLKKVTLKSGDVVVTVDYAQMLSGHEAATAAAAHGDESPPPNDYYIVNDNPKLRTFKLASSAGVKYLVGGDPTLHATSASGFLSRWESAAADATILRNPYWLTIHGGAIVKLEQQYLP